MITQKVYLYFPKSETDKPIVCELIRNYDLTINIFRAKVTPEEEGYLSLDITGTEENIERAYNYLNQFDVVIHAGTKGVHWDGENCTHCGNCISHCPTAALFFTDRRIVPSVLMRQNALSAFPASPTVPLVSAPAHFNTWRRKKALSTASLWFSRLSTYLPV